MLSYIYYLIDSRWQISSIGIMSYVQWSVFGKRRKYQNHGESLFNLIMLCLFKWKIGNFFLEAQCNTVDLLKPMQVERFAALSFSSDLYLLCVYARIHEFMGLISCFNQIYSCSFWYTDAKPANFCITFFLWKPFFFAPWPLQLRYFNWGECILCRYNIFQAIQVILNT